MPKAAYVPPHMRGQQGGPPPQAALLMQQQAPPQGYAPQPQFQQQQQPGGFGGPGTAPFAPAHLQAQSARLCA
jgi:hypothetical protein